MKFLSLWVAVLSGTMLLAACDSADSGGAGVAGGAPGAGGGETGGGGDGGASSGEFYVDSNDANASDSGPGSISQPWRTLAPLDNRSFAAGSTIYFARGSSYSGGVTLSSSGTSAEEITFTAYGTGDAPSFTSAEYDNLHGNVFRITGSHTVIDGLYFHSTPSAPNRAAGVDVLQVGAVFVATGADYVTIRNSEFDDTPIGINFLGQDGLITGNYLHDSIRFLSDPDWGPLGVVLGNSHIEVSHNRCDNFVHVGGNYGADGGFLEVDDRYFGNSAHDLNIHHNKTVGNMGFLEVEGQNNGANIDVAYNSSDDYQEFVFYWGGNNSKIENNTVIRTRPSLNGAVNTVFTMRSTGFAARNNIFVVANGVQVWVSAPYGVDGGYASAVKENNLYYCTDGCADPSGVPPGSGDMIGDPEFVDLAGGDYCLTSGSIAIDAGQSLEYTSDVDGRGVPQGAAPDIGAYECN